MFLFNKMHGLFDFRSLTFKIKIIEKAKHSFVSRRLIFKLQQEILKFNDICVSCGARQNWPADKYFKPENRSLENISIVAFKQIFDIRLLNNLFLFWTYLFP